MYMADTLEGYDQTYSNLPYQTLALTDAIFVDTSYEYYGEIIPCQAYPNLPKLAPTSLIVLCVWLAKMGTYVYTFSKRP